ncbi:hypothetical protein TREPR_3199 [Treponema primitia ZAS-2]|uniref:Uncharacterized protein n=1 Tax=Treponema primitia (strain ATCC BAA-887 / DSM 12427 / ZAS-2) TaxID=545694 RepID=F5YL13_TREPZ|nr:hypothetical protein TREPR_3199 [Treponema primitia ZAS-2]
MLSPPPSARYAVCYGGEFHRRPQDHPRPSWRHGSTLKEKVFRTIGYSHHLKEYFTVIRSKIVLYKR